tara:strand:+ start:3428 stop:3628 length:201 start_codon:yes stop_codon:yes gene_type:complete
MKEEITKFVEVQEVNTVWADSQTGTVTYTCLIDGENVNVRMCLYQALHLHDIEYIKTTLIKYIKGK